MNIEWPDLEQKQRLPEVFFTSDTHFYHAKMAEYRGFANVLAMNDAMIDAWNRKVPKTATVYHLGDVSFAGATKTLEVIDALNGKKILVPGNHDRKLSGKALLGFEQVLPALHELKLAEQCADGTAQVYRFVLCHFPMLVWNRMHHGAMHLHGHSHGNLNHPRPGGRMMDVGVDAAYTEDFSPIPLGRVLEIMSATKFVGFDQHMEEVA